MAELESNILELKDTRKLLLYKLETFDEHIASIQLGQSIDDNLWKIIKKEEEENNNENDNTK